MPSGNRIKKRPSAKTRVRKINKDVLSSQFSQSQIQSQALSQSQTNLEPRTIARTPVRKNKAPNSLVMPHQTIFSPQKKDGDLIDDDAQDHEEKSELSDDTDTDLDKQILDDNIIEIESSADEKNTGEKDASEDSNHVNTYYLPLSTRKWQSLPQQAHSELSTLLHLLSPPSLESAGSIYLKAFEDSLLKPLTDRFANVLLPPVHKNANNVLQQQRQRQRSSTDFNLKTLHQEQTRLNTSYDVNSKQLDTLFLQLLREKEAIATERRFLHQLKGKINRWKKGKEKRLERLKSQLGNDFDDINHILDSRNSGVNSVDDLDMIDDDIDKVSYTYDTENIVEKIDGVDEINGDNDDEDDEGNERVVSTLVKFKDFLDNVENSTESTSKFETSLRQLLNQLDM